MLAYTWMKAILAGVVLVCLILSLPDESLVYLSSILRSVLLSSRAHLLSLLALTPSLSKSTNCQEKVTGITSWKSFQKDTGSAKSENLKTEWSSLKKNII